MFRRRLHLVFVALGALGLSAGACGGTTAARPDGGGAAGMGGAAGAGGSAGGAPGTGTSRSGCEASNAKPFTRIWLDPP